MLETPIVPDSVYDKVYEPAEDSFLLLDLFEELRPRLAATEFVHRTPLVVEIGTGSGIVTAFLNKHILPRAVFVATDVNPHSCVAALHTNTHNTTSYNMDVIRCDLTSPILRGTVDVLIFNPPYVPSEGVPEIPSAEDDPTWLDLALDGGPTGMDVTQRVLDSLYETLAVGGHAYIIFCARNKPETVVEQFLDTSQGSWDVKKVIQRKAGWEILSVYEFIKLA